MQKQSVNTHLTKDDIIKTGSIYTGPALVQLVLDMVDTYIDQNCVIGDFGSGYGAFIEYFKNKGKRCFGTEFDDNSFKLLKELYPDIDLFHENSLSNIERDKYGLQDNDSLIVVGNPPYNDTTSIYHKGEKGTIVCDDDVLSRDFGISFLKAYNKLKAKYVCVLHPLAYLIKKQNFNSLGGFKGNYKLKSATIFSSKEFESIKKSNSDFPVVAALYERDPWGMDFDYIKYFKFDIYKSNKKFTLNDILTIDGLVEKYPQKGKSSGLQFYTLRDMNALLRNAGFVENRALNGVCVSDDTLCNYAWLFFLKNNFKPKNNRFIYGNLSPLYTKRLKDDKFKNEVVSYAYNNDDLVKKYYSDKKIEELYGPIVTQYPDLSEEIDIINTLFD